MDYRDRRPDGPWPGEQCRNRAVSAERGTGVNGLARPTQLLKWLTAAVVSVGIVLGSGLVLVAVVTQAGSTDTWNRWSSAGQAFGVLTAVFSGFALAALVITFWMQLQELKAQRTELCQQRELLAQAQTALHRSAEADIRALHTDLMKMAIDDNDLADVWPPLQSGLLPRRNRQYLYANLVIQHAWLNIQIRDYSEAEMRNNLRHLFASPLIREYWADTQARRERLLVPGTPEFAFNEIADEVFREQVDPPSKGWRPSGPPPDQEAA
jgi:hypothetical protein